MRQSRLRYTQNQHLYKKGWIKYGSLCLKVMAFPLFFAKFAFTFLQHLKKMLYAFSYGRCSDPVLMRLLLMKIVPNIKIRALSGPDSQSQRA